MTGDMHNRLLTFEIGSSLFALPIEGVHEVAEMAEAYGFDSVWMPEHLIFPAEMPPKYLYTPDGYPPMRSDTPAFDPWVVLGGVATRTSTIRLATGVFILPLRHPIMVARSVVTLDRLSGGRVVLGMAHGQLGLVDVAPRRLAAQWAHPSLTEAVPRLARPIHLGPTRGRSTPTRFMAASISLPVAESSPCGSKPAI